MYSCVWCLPNTGMRIFGRSGGVVMGRRGEPSFRAKSKLKTHNEMRKRMTITSEETVILLVALKPACFLTSNPTKIIWNRR